MTFQPILKKLHIIFLYRNFDTSFTNHPTTFPLVENRTLAPETNTKEKN
jgi:hypothetical protein